MNTKMTQTIKDINKMVFDFYLQRGGEPEPLAIYYTAQGLMMLQLKADNAEAQYLSLEIACYIAAHEGSNAITFVFPQKLASWHMTISHITIEPKEVFTSVANINLNPDDESFSIEGITKGDSKHIMAKMFWDISEGKLTKAKKIVCEEAYAAMKLHNKAVEKHLSNPSIH